MNHIKSYIIAFLSGALIVSIGVLIYLLKHSKPVINADTFIESLEQEIGKIKQNGQGGSQTITPTINLPETQEKEAKKKRKFLIFKRKNKEV